MNLVMVFLGAGIGGSLRYGVGHLATKLIGVSSVWATLTVNISGSFLIGVLYTVLARPGTEPSLWQLFLITGMLGGFTTFSAFSAETIQLFQNGKVWIGCAYVAASVVFSLSAFLLGDFLAKAVTQ